VIVIGATLSSTLGLLIQVENLAAQYWRALQIGPPPVLSDAQRSEVLLLMKSYGRQADPEMRPR